MKPQPTFNEAGAVKPRKPDALIDAAGAITSLQ